MFHAVSAESERQNDPSLNQLRPQQGQDLSPHTPGVPAPASLRAAAGGVPPVSPLQGARGQLAHLHSTYGNRAVLRMLSRSAPTIQTKLAVSKPGDEFEQEADRVADQVMRMPAPAPSIQRKCSGCDEEDKLQRKCAECEEEEKKGELHRKETNAGPQFAPPSVQAVLNSPSRPLDPATRAFMEPRFGQHFSNVRLHTDSQAAQSARTVNALAYTVGRDIVFGRGQYAPGSSKGRNLIAHELAHVIQQTVGPAFTLVQRQPSPPAPTTSTAPAPCPLYSDFPDDRSARMDMMCVSSTSKNPVCTLTDKHLALLKAAQTEARQRVLKAHFRMFAVGGPEFAERTGKKIFTDGPPSKEVIVKTLEALDKILQSQMTFAGGTCADPNCENPANLGQHAAAYESGPAKPVVFCPRSFLPDFMPEMRRSVLHEAIHLSGIDVDPNTTEAYCMAYTCDASCQSTSSADAWTLFIDCIGGALPGS